MKKTTDWFTPFGHGVPPWRIVDNMKDLNQKIYEGKTEGAFSFIQDLELFYYPEIFNMKKSYGLIERTKENLKTLIMTYLPDYKTAKFRQDIQKDFENEKTAINTIKTITNLNELVNKFNEVNSAKRNQDYKKEIFASINILALYDNISKDLVTNYNYCTSEGFRNVINYMKEFRQSETYKTIRILLNNIEKGINFKIKIINKDDKKSVLVESSTNEERLANREYNFSELDEITVFSTAIDATRKIIEDKTLEQEFDFLLRSMEFYDWMQKNYKEIEKEFPIVHPVLKQHRQIINFKNAFNPLLVLGKLNPKDYETWYKIKPDLTKHITPNNIYLDENESFLLLNGPNQAGKTTHTRTIGINVLLGSLGFKVFAEKATQSVFDQFLTNYVNKDSLSKGEGGYLSELKTVGNLLDWSTKKSLFLFDEPFRGTNPIDGSRKVIELLKVIDESKRFGVGTTHLEEVAKKALEMMHIKLQHSEIKVEKNIKYYLIKNGFTNTTNAPEIESEAEMKYSDMIKRIKN